MQEHNVNDLPESLFDEDMPLEERKDNMMSIADSFGEEEHQKKFTEEEKQRFKDQLADISIELSQLDRELKRIVKEQKDLMRPLESERKKILENLSTGSVWTKETLYRIAVPEKGVVAVYDSTGKLQRVEKLKRGLQTTMKLLTGTDG